MNKKRKKTIIWLSVSGIILVIIFFSALIIGRYTISIPSFFSALFNMPSADSIDKSVIFSLRLPRTLVALLVGIALSLSGLVYQETFQNKLVSPDFLGVSTGQGSVRRLR